MKLYYAPTSPFVRKVMVLLEETGQLGDVTIENVALTPLNRPDALQPMNPLSKIPALERPDGPAIYDSRVICAFLDDRAKGGMYPTGARLWETRTLESTADGIMDAAVLMVYEGRVRPDDKQWDGWVDAQWAKVSGGIAALNNRWMGYLAGPMDIGHIAVGCALAYVDFRHGDRDWRSGNEALATWLETFESRPSMVATRPPAA